MTETAQALSEGQATKDTTSARTPEQIREDVVEQRRISQDYMNNQIYGEWAEIYQSMKARVSPMMVENEKGELEEDRSRTNVCLPDHFIMVRRGVARLTRNPPNLRARGGPNQESRDKIATLLMYQWDRGHAQREFRKMVHSAKGLGWAVGKCYWDKVVYDRRFRRPTESLTREEALRLQGIPDQQIAMQVRMMGNQLSPDEIGQLIQYYGHEVQLNSPTTHYQGPLLENVFVGDVFPEPGFKSIYQSDYLIENSMRDEDWLKYWTNVDTEDPFTGETKPVVDEKVAQELLDKAENRNFLEEKENNLRRQFREAVGFTDPQTAGGNLKPPRKRFMIDERHMIVDGHYCVDYVGEESLYLGRLWYPWDLYGRSCYVEMTLIPDMLGGIGDSTPRVTRYIHQMRNTRANQITDFITNKLLPLGQIQENEDLTQKDLIRTAFMRLVRVKKAGAISPLLDPQFPPEAFQDVASLIRELQEADPSMADYSPGTPAIPEPGKLATALELQKQGADSITADELSQIGETVKNIHEIWMAMNQQMMQEKQTIDPTGISRVESLWQQIQERSRPRQEAYSIRPQGGEPKLITINPMEIQYDFDILPEEGSTMATDDEYKLKALMQALALAMQNPDVMNKRAIITKLCQVMPGISPEEVLLPPMPPKPPLPHMTFNLKDLMDMPPDVAAWFLRLYGIPETMMHVKGAMKGIQDLADTADAATRLQEPIDYSRPAGNQPSPRKPGGSGRNRKGPRK